MTSVATPQRPANNPLVDFSDLPRFDAIRPEHVAPAIDYLLARNRAEVNRLLDEVHPQAWHTLADPLERIEDELSRAWSPVSHLNSVMNNAELREAHNACLPKLSEYASEMGQDARLHAAFRAIAESAEFQNLEQPQRKIIENALRDFRLSGIDLPPEEQTRYREIAQELSQLNSKFSENVLDCTNAWFIVIRDEARLKGLPDSALELAREEAKRREVEDAEQAWVFTLEFPSYIAIMTHAEDRALREELYSAYVTRASDEGPHNKGLDNTPIMERILELRHEKSRLLGFANYAELSLATKMARNTEEVIAFLRDLAQRTMPMAKTELQTLRDFAKASLGIGALEAWDIAYVSEKLKLAQYDFSDEELRPWFPIDRVLSGLFEIVQRLYGIRIEERQTGTDGIHVWHSDVRFFQILHVDGTLQGQFYLDLFARPNKRGGAWMDDCITRQRREEGVQNPVAYLVCNFTPPVGGKPALLTHDEVLTLFHEFGHGLHHMLTRVDWPSVAGIGGVAWDAVELPSQFMENWCWQPEALPLISGHYQTGEPLPQDKFDKLLAARNFQSGMQMLRQLEFSLFDFRLHADYKPGVAGQVFARLGEVRDEVSVLRPPSFNRFPHSFSHIFAGGYAAGYYSYKWAEVLSADAFAAFEENGIFDRDTGERFLSAVLEQGGSREPMELFIEFRGREPEIDALLRHSGIAA